MIGGLAPARVAAAALSVVFLALTTLCAHAEPTVTQTFQLRPGWNAIFLEVQPQADSPATIFNHPSIESVWAWLESNSTMEFIDDPSEEKLDRAGWRAYFSQEKGFLTNLHAITANHAYLVKVAGSQVIPLTVTGTPSAGKIQWVPDSFNLVGFHLEGPPLSFQEFFAPSSAHFSAASGAIQAAYRLNGEDRWEYVETSWSTLMKPGEAYWVYCEGGSDYQGPLSIDIDAIDFGLNLARAAVTLKNHTTSAKEVSLAEIPSQNASALAFRQFNDATGYYDWPDLAAFGSVVLGAGESQTVHLAIRREKLAPGPAASTLEIRDDAGMRWLVPVTAER